MSGNEPVFVPGTIEKETDAALMIRVKDPTNTLGAGWHGEAKWFPKSQCEIHEDGIEVPEWLIEKKIADED